MKIILMGNLLCVPLQLHAGNAPDCANSSAKTINKAAEPYQDAIRKAAKRYAVKPELITAVIAGGSCFDPLKVSPKGALGLMQLLPATAIRFGALDITDPAANIDAGARYLSYLSGRYAGNIAAVLAAHAADEGWEWSDETIHSRVQDIREPVTRTLGILLKLDNRKQANREAKALLKTWSKSAKAYQQALLATPQTRAHKVFVAWYKARLEKVHYARTPEARSCGGFSAKMLGQKAAPYETIIQKAAKRHGVNVALIKSVIAAESCYREMVVSPKGAAGLMQLMPETAADLGVMDIFDPEENINAGARYLGWLVRYYGGSFTHAIAAYNAGPGRITPGAPVTIEFAETRGYINTVLTHLTRLESSKNAIQQAQLLLADWQEAEFVYQAALRGETIAVAPPTAEPADGALPATQQTEPHPEVILATYRTVQTGTSAQPTPVPLANAQLIPASLNQDVVRVKRISSVTTSIPEETPPIAAPTGTTQAAQATAQVSLADCSTLPAGLPAQTQQQGSGRFAAYFYPVQSGETLESIAQKLGLNAQEIMQLGKLPPNTLPKQGALLRVAECIKTGG